MEPLAEEPAEGAETLEADLHADVGDRSIGTKEQRLGPLQPELSEILVRRLVEGGKPT